MANVGDYLTIKGVKKRWAGENYGWQTPASYSQLEKQGKFKVGAQFLDKLGSYLSPIVQQVQGVQQQVRQATPFLDPIENLVNRAVKAEDKLPSSVVARGGILAAQQTGEALNLDPRLGIAAGLLIGGVHKDGPKAGTYKWKPTPDLKAHTDVIEDAIEGAHQHFKRTGSLKGANTLIELPDGQALRISNKGNVDFNRRTGLSPVATTAKARPAAAPNVSTNVSTAVKKIEDAKSIVTKTYGIDGINYDRLLDEIPVTSILDPRYVARVEALVDSSTKNWETLKSTKNISASRVLSSLMGQPIPDLYPDILGTISPKDFYDVEQLTKVYSKLKHKFSGMSSQEMFGPQFIEGHHPIQVESVAKASKHLPVFERLKFLDILRKDYTYGGNEPRDMFGITALGHQGNYALGPAPFTAHQSIDTTDLVKPGFTPKTGDNWSTIDFTDFKDPKSLAKEFMNQSGFPQISMAELAFDSSSEQLVRARTAKELGVRERELYTMYEGDPRGKKFKKLIPKETMKEIMQSSYYPDGTS